ncbi:LysR family transcriptional regulator [Ensifer adhaerens]|uniref:LysR family transcriptional regulator n=1 Tax=Ensifer adhaerens TaxID=106592 RepID=UPI001CBEEDCA|nr:LysR family transcriptional regulator [Ensifer adhaerens]MBZ7922261.1 LysR family transcriptional regulator [Ensifer adhaerens]UAX90903.1 LysR family transcriptional regulator [Ensifer adhaerens]UAX98532.1 LysR family transcriptional regulator [Ensifer adhaerens]UAY05913.1 LysR family transcriptional regulator [Ensifer adhaerens]
MHPRLLTTFLAVSRHRNITRAAAEVHLAQSSVSDQIQSLEAELGATLLVRAKAGLELTAAGEALRLYAEEMLALADEARAAVAAAAGQQAGALTIGALETIASAQLAPFLSRFRAAHGDIDLRLTVAGSGDLLRRLETGEIDVAFSFGEGTVDERLVRRVIAAEPIVLIVPPGHAALAKMPTMAELAAADFLITERGCIYRAIADRAFAEAGVSPRRAAEVGSLAAIARLVAKGAGVALVPRLAVADALARDEIGAVAWPGPTRSVPLSMIWRRRRVQLPALRRLLAAASDDLAPAVA